MLKLHSFLEGGSIYIQLMKIIVYTSDIYRSCCSHYYHVQQHNLWARDQRILHCIGRFCSSHIKLSNYVCNAE